MLTLNFNPFTNLESERLFLRRVSIDDYNEIIELRGNPENMKYIPRPLINTKEDAVKHFEMIEEKINSNLGINWAVTLKGESKLIGIIGLYKLYPENYRCEVGYMILPQYSSIGIGSEALNCVLKFGFDNLKMHSIEAIIDPENVASEQVLKKNGFVKEAHILENEYYDGKFWDTVIYSILKRNFKN